MQRYYFIQLENFVPAAYIITFCLWAENDVPYVGSVGLTVNSSRKVARNVRLPQIIYCRSSVILVVKWDVISCTGGSSVSHWLIVESIEHWWNGSWREGSWPLPHRKPLTPTWTTLRLNQGFLGGKPITNRLRCGPAYLIALVHETAVVECAVSELWHSMYPQGSHTCCM